jgi:carbohydrate kinase (thermoresistant glucokinase family)
MRAGTPLTDEDRWPWLDAMAAHLEAERGAGRHCVLACSALRRAYRERLARGHEDVRFVFLEGDFATIESRMARRTGHYMPASLLASQFATLEPPGADENALTMPVEAAPAELVDAIVARLGLA